MPQFRNKTTESTETSENGATPARKPSEQALEVVDTTFGAAPRVADAVRKQVEQLRNPETRSQELEKIQQRVNTLRDPQTRDSEIETLRQRLNAEVEKAKAEGPELRRKATEQFVEQAKKARQRVEQSPVYKQRVEPVYKQRVEPVVRQRVEPVYRQRVEPTVKRVRERI